MRPVLTTAVELAALACIVAGVGWISAPAGLLALGACLLVVAWGLSR